MEISSGKRSRRDYDRADNTSLAYLQPRSRNQSLPISSHSPDGSVEFHAVGLVAHTRLPVGSLAYLQPGSRKSIVAHLQLAPDGSLEFHAVGLVAHTSPRAG